MVAKRATVKARGFAVAEGRTLPRRIRRTGIDVIEGIFQFETALGRGFGVVRLLANEPAKAFQLMTNLHELKGFEETIGTRRPTGEAYSRNFGGTNWKDQRIASQRYTEREPTVLVVGGGQAGLTVAATLGHLGVDTLVIDKLARVGDCWRTRYHSLALHNPTHINHLPYMPFPPNWPVYLPKDMLADWFEAYAWAMELNFWTSSELVSGAYDASAGRWKAVVRNADGSERTVRPKHLIFANGFVTQEVLVGKLLGEAVAKKVGPVWGIAADGEMNNMWRRTAQEGLWFVGGSFTNCRIYSRVVALQIKAIEEGLLSKE